MCPSSRLFRISLVRDRYVVASLFRLCTLLVLYFCIFPVVLFNSLFRQLYLLLVSLVWDQLERAPFFQSLIPPFSLSPGVRSFKLTPPSGVLLKSLAVAIRQRTRSSYIPNISRHRTFRFVGRTSHFPEQGVSILQKAYDVKFIGNLISGPQDVAWKAWTRAALCQASMSSSGMMAHLDPLLQHAHTMVSKLEPRVKHAFCSAKALHLNVQCHFLSVKARNDMPAVFHPVLAGPSP